MADDYYQQEACPLCGGAIPPSNARAVLKDGRHVCFACSALGEALAMRATGKAFLYDDDSSALGFVTDFGGKLRLPVTKRTRGKHNIARTRTDVWFQDLDGARWHGVRCGDNGTYLRCKRVNS